MLRFFFSVDYRGGGVDGVDLYIIHKCIIILFYIRPDSNETAVTAWLPAYLYLFMMCTEESGRVVFYNILQ